MTGGTLERGEPVEVIISNSSDKPIYEQICIQVKKQIMDGALQAGEALPSMRALARDLHISVITVQRAYEDLTRDGFIETVSGKGSFVAAQNREFIQEDNLERNYTDFEEQYRAYIGEHTDFIFRDWQRYGELLDLLESDRLAKAISRLKDRDREILFARVYGELTFAELGERFHMEPKQAEMAYYYVLRKLRKEMNGNDRF